jgi:hypothetical protein
MTTPATDRTTATTSRTSDDMRPSAVGDPVSEAALNVRDTAAEAISRLPDVAATTRSAIEDANSQIRAGSDEMLAAGTLLSFGFAAGLLVGGANRLLVTAALVPVAMLGFNLLDRATRAAKRPASGGRLQAG